VKAELLLRHPLVREREVASSWTPSRPERADR
jgi:hypothetical protein